MQVFYFSTKKDRNNFGLFALNFWFKEDKRRQKLIMIIDNIIVNSIKNELRDKIINSRIEKIFQPDYNSFVFQIFDNKQADAKATFILRLISLFLFF